MLSLPGRDRPRVTGREPLLAVAMEIGRQEPWISVEAHADEKVHLAFSSGVEFRGGCQNLPSRIGVALRGIMSEAAPLLDRLPPRGSAGALAGQTVRIALFTATTVRADGAGIAELREGRSVLSPLWNAFAELLGPMVATLFSQPTGRDAADGLTRAWRLWVDPSWAPDGARRRTSRTRDRLSVPSSTDRGSCE